MGKPQLLQTKLLMRTVAQSVLPGADEEEQEDSDSESEDEEEC